MKFLFLPAGCLPFHGKTLEQRPIGGTETGIIRLAEALVEQGHEVTVIAEVENPPLTPVLYIPSRAMQFVGPVDVLIGVRDWRMCLLPIQAKKRFFLTGDAYDQPISTGIGDTRVSRHIDAFLAVSEWHAQTMCDASGFPPERAFVIRNGIKRELFDTVEQKIPKRLIYSSTPYRGLALLPKIFGEIVQKHPDASLHVFSGYEVYGGSQSTPPAQLAEFEQIKGELLKLPNVYIKGNVLQKDLALEFLRSSILAYPNTFAETSCITAMEAQAAGCVPVTSALGALPETVGDAGMLVPANPGSEEYLNAFTQALHELLSDSERLGRLAAKGRERSAQFSWDEVAKRVIQVAG